MPFARSGSRIVGNRGVAVLRHESWMPDNVSRWLVVDVLRLTYRLHAGKGVPTQCLLTYFLTVHSSTQSSKVSSVFTVFGTS